MTQHIDIEHLTLKYISNVDIAVLKQFQCDRDDINAFLYEDAIYYHDQNLTKTILGFHESDLIGFFSLSSDAIRLSKSEIFELGMNGEFPITFFPAVKITKIAISTLHMRKGLGSHFITLIEGLIYDLPLAIKFITLDAVNEPNIIQFYESNGFVESMSQASERRAGNKPTILMHKNIYGD